MTKLSYPVRSIDELADTLREAFSLNGFRMSSPTAFRAAFAHALASDRGSVIECVIDIDEPVQPMISSGNKNADYLPD